MKWTILRRRGFAIALTTCLICLMLSGLPLSWTPAKTVMTPSLGLTLENVGTSEVYFARQGKPLLSFGGMSDFIFYAAPDAFNYEGWADWAAAHGMNHVRAYPPMSWRFIEKFARDNGGAPENLLFPYRETSPGNRQFDLTEFDEAYWRRFRQQCEYLQSKGIIVHLLMVNGWQLEENDRNWGGHFFNPENNINDFTDDLAGDRLAFYKSVSAGNTALVEAQQAWFEKMVEVTADLDNVYYDLVHEIAENHQDWEQAKAWITTMAETVRSHYQTLQPNRAIILGMDTGGLAKRQREWIFSQPYFDVLIYGKMHTVKQARDWRDRYNKPYIPQESWDDDGTKYTLRNPDNRVHLRKYLWKFMMAKCQQMDIYARPLRSASPAPSQTADSSTGQPTEYAHNYDPTTGRVPFEDDAIVLRQLWRQLTDYANLGFNGRVQSGPGKHRYVLSSSEEGLVYLSSDTRQQAVSFEAKTLQLRNLALSDGGYTAEIISPATGSVSTLSVTVERGRTSFSLPAFTDDLAVHIVRNGEGRLPSPAGERSPQSNSRRVARLIRGLITTVFAVISGVVLGGFFKKGRRFKKD